MEKGNVPIVLIVTAGFVLTVFFAGKACVLNTRLEFETLQACIKETQKPLECRHAYRRNGQQ